MTPSPRRRWAPRPDRGAATETITATARRQDPRQGTARRNTAVDARFPRSFAEWDRLLRERPFGRGWHADDGEIRAARLTASGAS